MSISEQRTKLCAYGFAAVLTSGQAFAQDNNSELGLQYKDTQPFKLNLEMHNQEECAKYSSLSMRCVEESVIGVDASYNDLISVSIEGMGQQIDEDINVFTTHTKLNEFLVGIGNENAQVQVGMFDLKPALIDYYDKDRSKAPISLDTQLRKQIIQDQVGIIFSGGFAIGDKWSVQSQFAATQSKYMHFQERDEEIYSFENQSKFAQSNGLDVDFFYSALNQLRQEYHEIRDQIEDFEVRGADILNVRDSINISTLTDLYEDIKDTDFNLSHDTRDLIIIGTIYSFERKKGKEKLLDKIDTQKIADKYNEFLNNTQNRLEGVEIPEDLQEELLSFNRYLNFLGEEITPGQAADADARLHQTLQNAVETIDGVERITPEQIREALSGELDAYHEKLKAEVQKRPQDFQDAIYKNVNNIAQLHQNYQTVSDTPSYHADIALKRETPTSIWVLGMSWNRLAAGSELTVDEERYSLYSIWNKQISEKWSYNNEFHIEYDKNPYGLADKKSGNVILNNQLNYQPNKHIELYASMGFSGGFNEGAIAAVGTGIKGCFNHNRYGDLCAQAAYEYSHDINNIGHEYLDIEKESGSGARLGFSYNYVFE